VKNPCIWDAETQRADRGEPMKLNKRYRHFKQSQYIKLALIYGLGALIVIISGLYGDPHETEFIRACVMQTTFALFTNWFQTPEFDAYFLFSLLSIVTTLMISAAYEPYHSAGLSFFFYPIVTLIMSFVHFNVPFPKWFILPQYIPDGFEQVDYWIFGGNLNRPTVREMSAGIIYEETQGSKIIIGGTIPETLPKTEKKLQTSEICINGIAVSLEEEAPSTQILKQDHKKFPFINANWYYHAYYRLTSEGISLEEVEKVIALMIPDEPISESQKEGA
jgi:hypothetical protein